MCVSRHPCRRPASSPRPQGVAACLALADRLGRQRAACATPLSVHGRRVIGDHPGRQPHEKASITSPSRACPVKAAAVLRASRHPSPAVHSHHQPQSRTRLGPRAAVLGATPTTPGLAVLRDLDTQTEDTAHVQHASPRLALCVCREYRTCPTRLPVLRGCASALEQRSATSASRAAQRGLSRTSARNS